jgi:ApbE superfamily uncharacterized protein (UPF0280 family)
LSTMLRRLMTLCAIVTLSCLAGSMSASAAEGAKAKGRDCKGDARGDIGIQCSSTPCVGTTVTNNSSSCDVQFTIEMPGGREGKCLAPGGQYKTECGCGTLVAANYRDCK